MFNYTRQQDYEKKCFYKKKLSINNHGRKYMYQQSFSNFTPKKFHKEHVKFENGATFSMYGWEMVEIVVRKAPPQEMKRKVEREDNGVN